MVAKTQTASDTTRAYRLRRRHFLWGTWLKHAQITPYYIHLVHRGHARYVRKINELLEVDGNIEALESPLDHFSFSKGISHWIAKHNIYSTMEAQLLASGAAYCAEGHFLPHAATPTLQVGLHDVLSRGNT